MRVGKVWLQLQIELRLKMMTATTLEDNTGTPTLCGLAGYAATSSEKVGVLIFVAQH